MMIESPTNSSSRRSSYQTYSRNRATASATERAYGMMRVIDLIEKKAVLTNQDLFSKLDAEKMEVEDEDEIDDAVAVVKQPLYRYNEV